LKKIQLSRPVAAQPKGPHLAGRATLRKLPSLKALQAFEAAARLVSFTSAADELRVTTSAVSHQIRFLEEEIGAVLFHRNSRTVVLTDVGARYFREVAEAFTLLEAATRDIERRATADILTIHCVPSLAAQWLMPRLARFGAAHDGIDVRLNASVDVIDLAAGGVDVDIRYGRVLPSNGVVVTPLPDETIVALCSPELAGEASRPIREPADLRDHTLIHSEVNLISWRMWAKQHGDLDLDFDRGPRFDRSFMSISAAIDGLGVCLESDLLVQRELESGRLVAPFGRKGPKVHCHSMCVLRTKQNIPKIRTFRSWLFQQLGTQLP
jgi:LysR family transcriptional regulator, glycine cleavage system transcriptional activator